MSPTYSAGQPGEHLADSLYLTNVKPVMVGDSAQRRADALPTGRLLYGSSASSFSVVRESRKGSAELRHFIPVGEHLLQGGRASLGRGRHTAHSAQERQFYPAPARASSAARASEVTTVQLMQFMEPNERQRPLQRRLPARRSHSCG